jgi:archaemetzincin
VPALECAFDLRRAQDSAQALLQQLLSRRAERVLGVVDLDLYVPELNFVFGLADWRERRVVIALP